MKIAIIGAGWFGCHIASELIKEGYKIKIFEKANDIFLGASGFNQNRLHLGFHYPRSFLTREQSKKGFKFFKKNYPTFSKKIQKNMYAISLNRENILDFETYLQILKSSNLRFKKLKLNSSKVKNISGLIKCEEEFIDTNIAKKFFTKKFKNILHSNKEVKQIKKLNNKVQIFGENFDYVVNCSWQQFNPVKRWKLKFELCFSLLYKSKSAKSMALTIMDGPFYTLYPWSKKIFNLYSVKYSRLKKSSNFSHLKNKKEAIKLRDLNKIKNVIEKEFSEYYPSFKKDFKFIKFIKTFRTLVDKKDHSRDYKIFYKDKIFNILSGKIDHIFLASEDLKKSLKTFHKLRKN